MASYLNRKNERVEVTEDHIETAIEIKIELQKESPSNKCSWARHKKMMKEEGYDDSDSNEGYRQFIKSQQKQRGKLPEVKKYADIVSDKKLESVRNAIGEMYISKRHAQNSYRELNKVKREFSDNLMLLDSIEESMKNMDFGSNITISNKQLFNNNKKSKKMIACISDPHYGAVVDIEGRKYNPEMTPKIMMDYADKLIDIAIRESVDEIHVVGLGDLVEHSSMRPQNTYSVDRLLSEQVTEISDIIISFLRKLATHFKITYSAIAGNHDRFIGNKNHALFGEHIVSISNKIIETFIRYSGVENIEYIPTESYHHIMSINNKNFLFVHGDTTPLKKDTILAEQSALFNIHFDAILGGHIHHFTMREVAEDRFIATFGSIKGTDDFSLKTIGTSASRSQGVILIDKQGEFEIRKIKL